MRRVIVYGPRDLDVPAKFQSSFPNTVRLGPSNLANEVVVACLPDEIGQLRNAGFHVQELDGGEYSLCWKIGVKKPLAAPADWESRISQLLDRYFSIKTQPTDHTLLVPVALPAPRNSSNRNGRRT